ncbi:RelA/SpoT family protein [Micromonospora sp. NPDC000668]|uniref:RelA/SpoT family protein n=1 Tax=Micromonospora sp. NPDC000668 TaxID=3364219 RepID=UPI0036D0CBE3
MISADEILSRADSVRLLQGTQQLYHDWLMSLTDSQVIAGGWRFPGPRLREYLRVAKKATTVHPYPAIFPDTPQPPLSAVYVQQLVEANESLEDVGTHQSGQAIRSEEIFDNQTSSIVLGEAGSGKSSLLRTATGTLIRKFEDGLTSKVPVRVLAADLVPVKPLPEAIAKSVNEDLSSIGLPESWPADFFRKPPTNGASWLLLVDGLDEVMSSDQRLAIIRRLHECVEETGSGVDQFVVTSRPDNLLPRRIFPTLAVFELLIFDRQQLYNFAEGWLAHLGSEVPQRTAQRFVDKASEANLGELARNPLMAVMLCQLHIVYPDQLFPTGRSQLYETFVNSLLERQYRGSRNGIRHQINLITERYGVNAVTAGEQLLRDGTSLVERLAWSHQSEERGAAVQALDSWTRHLKPDNLPAPAWQSLLGELLRRSGVLTERGGDFVFSHKTIEEFLAARFITKNREESARQLRSVWDRHSWFDNQEWLTTRQSFLRFLIDGWARDQDLTPLLKRLTTKGQIDGCRLICCLSADGSSLNHGVIEKATNALVAIAMKRSSKNLQPAIELLCHLDYGRAKDALQATSLRRNLDHARRRWAIALLSNILTSESNNVIPIAATSCGYTKGGINAIARLQVESWRDFLATLADDPTLDGVDRRWCAEALVDVGDRRGLGLLRQIVNDVTVLAFDRRLALEVVHRMEPASGSKAAGTVLEREVLLPNGRVHRQVWRPFSLLTGQRVAVGVSDGSDVLAKLLEGHQLAQPIQDVRLLERAYDFSQRLQTLKGKNGQDPIFDHALAVLKILVELGMDATVLATTLLHLTKFPLSDVRDTFGDEVSELVQETSRVASITLTAAAGFQVSQRAIIYATSDPRVLMIILASCLQVLRSPGLYSVPEKRRIAKEALSVYSPLASRLGIFRIHRELDDLAFQAIYPQRYAEVDRLSVEHQPQNDTQLRQITCKVLTDLRAADLKAELTGKPKHLYPIYQKMIARGRDFNDIYDLVSVRILVDTVRDCYAALGVIHANWQLVPGRFKDYIAMPKFDLYQSLHTTVIGPTGKPVEMQIRTYAMHRIAEFGIAAHWRYKEYKGTQIVGPRAHIDEMTWLRQLADWQHKAADPREFLDALRFDLSSQEVYVFTPKGDVIPLPTGSTPVDFAYAVHTEVGHKCIGARVNGKLVPLESTLSNGDVIEILSSKSETAGPTQDWLGFVKSPRARTKIRQYFNKERREEAIEAGKNAIVKAMRKQGMPLQRMLTSDALMSIARDLHLADVASLYAAVGDSQVSAQSVVQKLMAAYGGEEGAAEDIAETAVATRPPRSRQSSNDPGVVVRGVSDVWIKLARCCTPVPPDSVFGFVTRSGGVSVHRDDCANAEDLRAQSERVVEVSWKLTSASTFLVAIQVEALDRHKLLADVTRVLSDERVNILAATLSTSWDRVAVSRFSFEMADPKHLGYLLAMVRKVDGVFDAYRVKSVDA